MGDEKTRKIFDIKSSDYDANRRRFHEFVLGFLLDAVPKGSKVLDVGCGTGEIAVGLQNAGYGVKGFDFSPMMIEKAAAKDGQIFKLGDAEEGIPFDEKFDYAISIDSWEFFPEPGKVLSNVHRALKENGTLIIVVPNVYIFPFLKAAELLGLKKLRPFGFFNSTYKKIEKLGKEEGFEITKTKWVYNLIARVFFLRKIA